MRRVFVTLTLMLGFSAVASIVRAQPTPPAPGVEIPTAFRSAFDEKGRFEFEHAWIEKTRIASENRERYIKERGFFKRGMMSSVERPMYAVTGTVKVPVFCFKYSDTPATPFPISQLQTKLFSGPYSPQTLTQYYNEISNGALNVTGTVYGWYTLPNTNAYYVPPDTCYGACGAMDEIIPLTIAANDFAVNFGQYDNDGPDGLPNSGDDDGYVDFVAFVQPERGGECGDLTNIWSHRSYLLPGPYFTNDARVGGGQIKISDFVVQPIYNCDNTTLIDIGVFCHEFGHAFGLPDLYDTDGGSRGVGNWCLMGHGNWNTPAQPAHMGAWTKSQLGWVDVVTAPSTILDVDIPAVETSHTVYRMDCAAQKWRWNNCFNGSDKGLHCGLQAVEANNRHWVSGAGYGNNWDTTISRDFYYNGSGPISLMSNVEFELQPNKDFAYTTITVGNTTSTLATYTGVNGDVLEVNLAPYMTGPGPYTLSYRVKSSPGSSDEDGVFATSCGAMWVWNVYVIGGGENYSTNFADRADGWAESPPFTEYFLVENRQPIGSDAQLLGSGLVVWHIDQTGGQTGGPNNDRPRGVEVEQADGLGHLEANVNYGDAGDPFPGTSNKTLFTSATNPSSLSHSGTQSVWMQVIGGNGNPIHAKLVGGFGAPSPDEVTPAAGTSGSVVQLQIDGGAFKKTPTAELVLHIPDDEARQGIATISAIPATSVKWIGDDRITATFNLAGAPNGLFDVVVYNPGGASSRLDAGYTISGATPTGAGDLPRTFGLSPNYPNPFNPTTTIRFQVPARVQVKLDVYDVSGALVRTLVNETKAPGVYALEWNGRDDKDTPVSSGVYFYRITAGDFSDVRKMTLLK